MNSVSAEIIGGVVGGLAVALTFALVPWYRNKYKRFTLRYLNPNESLTAENMLYKTALGIPSHSSSIISIHIRPHIGLVLDDFSVAFFDPPRFPLGLLPDRVGRRRQPSDICVEHSRFQLRNGKFSFCQLRTEKESITISNLGQRLYEEESRVLELYVSTSDVMKRWRGILGIRVLYHYNGNPGKRDIRTKVFVRAPEERRPFTFAWKKTTRAEIIESEIDRKRRMESNLGLGQLGYVEALRFEAIEHRDHLKRSDFSVLTPFHRKKFRSWYDDVQEYFNGNQYHEENIQWLQKVNIDIDKAELEGILKAYESGLAILENLARKVDQ